MKDVFKEGEKIKVKLIDIDKKTGKFRLSRKVLNIRVIRVLTDPKHSASY
ncbi:hypothetical protein [Candidatus Pollutiaquabacter sp.]